MRSYTIEVFADGRPIPVNAIVQATNVGAALRRGYLLAKPSIKRGTKIVTVRTTLLPAVTHIEE